MRVRRRAKSASEATAPRPLSGYKYLDQLDGLLTPLRPAATQRDKAGTRHLFFDPYARPLLVYFFNPAVTTPRGGQRFTTLEKVQRVCGLRPTAVGSLSEAARVFDPTRLEPIVAELARRAWARHGARPPAEPAALAGLIAVDGSYRIALMAIPA